MDYNCALDVLYSIDATVLHKKPISELRSVTCCMGSHSATCHQTQMNVARLNPTR